MNNITIRNARLIYRNFRGQANQYNPEGRRNFSVVIEDEDFANTLIGDGWNIKPLKKRNDEDPQHYHLPVAVVYGAYPPTIRMISQSGGVILDENTVGMLDWQDIVSVDLIIRPREYEVRGQKGIKAYLKSMNVTVQEDELAAEYNAQYGNYDPAKEDMPF